MKSVYRPIICVLLLLYFCL
jgi:dCTP diphosphatase